MNVVELTHKTKKEKITIWDVIDIEIIIDNIFIHCVGDHYLRYYMRNYDVTIKEVK